MCTLRSVIAILLALTILGQSTVPCRAATDRVCGESDSCGCGLPAGSNNQAIPCQQQAGREDFPLDDGESPTCPFCQSQVDVARHSTATLRAKSPDLCTSCVDYTSDNLTIALPIRSQSERFAVRIAGTLPITLCRLLR